jgi:hypothetical protein
MTLYPGTDGVLSVETIGSFFRNQTFPKNWHRRATAGGSDIVGNISTEILGLHTEVLPGANNAQGVYVFDNITDVSHLQLRMSTNSDVALSNSSLVFRISTSLRTTFLPFF